MSSKEIANKLGVSKNQARKIFDRLSGQRVVKHLGKGWYEGIFDLSRHNFSSNGNDVVAQCFILCLEDISSEQLVKIIPDNDTKVEIELTFNGVPVSFAKITDSMIKLYDKTVEDTAKELMDTNLQNLVEAMRKVEYDLKESIRVNMDSAFKAIGESLNKKGKV
jgi:DNA-binding IscR family transcriptional regulator